MREQLRIIVLDTSPTTRKILEVILRREGHQVASFDDSQEALCFLYRHGPADLLFLGLELLGMDGFDVLKYLRGEPRFHSMVPLAILGEGILVRLKARLAGAQQVVTKPLVRQRIVALVSEYACRIASAQESSQLTGSTSLEDCEVAPCPERNEPGRKALAFQQLAQSIEERGGVVPRTHAELERLRGIGPYTASAVLAIVYGRAEPLLDVNMARLLMRFLGSSQGAQASHRRALHAFALRLVRGKRSLEINWATLDFGALVCRARRPRCPECPLRPRCEYARSRLLQPTSSGGVL